jgi:hypothetical protein
MMTLAVSAVSLIGEIGEPTLLPMHAISRSRSL